MEHFDFRNALKKHPNIISVTEIDIQAIPKRVALLKSFLSEAFISTVKVGSLEYNLLISKPKKFPQKLPFIHLADPGQHDFHNHVNYEGDICYTEKDSGVFINLKQPEAVLHKALNLAIDVLAESVDRNLTGLFEEFEGYWASLPDCEIVRCFFDPGKEFIRVKALCKPDNRRKLNPIAFYKDSLPEHYGFTSKIRGLQSINAWYIPLEKSSFPPTPDSELSPTYVRNLLKHVASTERNKIFKEFKKPKKKKKNEAWLRNEIYIFSQPRPSAMLALFGVIVAGYSKYPFFQDTEEIKWKVSPISIKRHNRKYLLERGGAESSLQNFKIAVIGCGAVGSRVAEQLALCGAGKIILVDYDKLSEDNIYRHVLGGAFIGENKSEAMAMHLKHRLPYIDIDPKTKGREVWLENDGRNHVNIMIWSSKNGHPVKRLLPKKNYSQKHLGFYIPKTNGDDDCYKTFRYT